ncbi:MAG: SURF1 family protein [Parvibaculum sp.]|nr:SURF1 family protein [Parvibaculum sp.]
MSIAANRFFRPLLWPTLLTAAMLPVLVGLGVWQVQRLHWKDALLTRIESRLSEMPVDLPAPAAWDGLDAQALEYTRMRLDGVFGPREFHYFTQSSDGTPGYAVLSPLDVGGGSVVLVDRGFVPQALKDPAMHAGAPQGEVSFTGILRAPGRRVWVSGVDDPEKNIWMVRDPTVMGAELDAGSVAPFIVEAEAGAFPGEWPKAGTTRPDIPNNHLDYALTWFGLAVVLMGIYLSYHWSNGRIGNRDR